MIITKTYSICHRELTLENFRKDRTRKDGFHPWCKECQRIKRKESRNNNEIAKEGERRRLRATITKGCKSAHTLELLGCTVEEFRHHLEQQFEPGMTWDNCHKWHIDHIIPCAYFDLTKEENQRICFNYRNLQPLWARDNSAKQAKVPDNVEELVEFLKQEIYGN